MRNILYSSALVLSAVGTLACGNNARAPLTPSPAANPGASVNAAIVNATTVDGATIGRSRLKITKPVPVTPVDGVVVEDTSPDLTVQNSRGVYVSGLAFSYVFRVFNNQGTLVYTSDQILQGPDGTTTHEVDMDIDYNEVHTWDVQAFLGDTPGLTSDPAVFKTYDLPSYGESCAHLVDPFLIVECRKNNYGRIAHHELNDFLRGIAFDLSRSGHEHAPFGILQKPGGSNCNGYSCDIICSDAGGLQRQWDVLIDEDGGQLPAWNRVGETVTRVCEIVRFR